MDLSVATKLVVRMLLGAPWLSKSVSCIRPREGTITFFHQGVEKTSKLLEDHEGSQSVVRAVKSTFLEPMSETWLDLSTDRCGNILLLPA